MQAVPCWPPRWQCLRQRCRRAVRGGNLLGVAWATWPGGPPEDERAGPDSDPATPAGWPAIDAMRSRDGTMPGGPSLQGALPRPAVAAGARASGVHGPRRSWRCPRWSCIVASPLAAAAPPRSGAIVVLIRRSAAQALEKVGIAGRQDQGAGPLRLAPGRVRQNALPHPRLRLDPTTSAALIAMRLPLDGRSAGSTRQVRSSAFAEPQSFDRSGGGTESFACRRRKSAARASTMVVTGVAMDSTMMISQGCNAKPAPRVLK